MCAVGASPVVSSALANVFVSLSNPNVILVFCHMLESYNEFFSKKKINKVFFAKKVEKS